MSGDGKRSVASCYASSGWTVYLVENTKVTSLCPAGCLEPSISRDGKHVAFTSDGNIYVTDMLTTVHVSTASDGAAGNARQLQTRDLARWNGVVFSSGATNLVDHDTNLARDIFMKDLATGKTTRISESSAPVTVFDQIPLSR